VHVPKSLPVFHIPLTACKAVLNGWTMTGGENATADEVVISASAREVMVGVMLKMFYVG